ncbi:glycoside hydrolase family protein [Cedecea davisae]|uniref:glycoside hydrolase family protein n=1 Tax=Cedecea davisae TaxID=158484 RepID=UPI00376F17D8
MKICFPARKANGEHYATVDDMMEPLLQEPHGSWLAGTNNMWHGGIHITRKSAPGSVLTSETADTAVPLQFMAGGEVVAWRINQDYLTSTYINNPLQYSSTFVLVKSICTPDPEKKDNSLDFYSLYIGLAPLSAFPEHKLYQVTEKGDGLHKREYTGKEKAGDKAPVAEKNKLKTGDSVVVLREITFDLKGQTQTFGLARVLNSKSEMTGNAFWVSLDPQSLASVGKQMAHLPAWMQQAVTQGTFDTVVKPATRLEVAAGDAVGYLAEDIAPCDIHGVEKSAFVHIEVLSTDSRMIDFLSNKAQVKSGPKYVHIHPESFVYARSGDTFTQTKGQVKKDIHKIMPQDKCHPFTDSGGKRWFDIGEGAWVSGTDVDADICQYDLTKLGFSTFEEPPTSDMTKSLHEGWIKDGFTRMAEWVRPERGIREKQVSDYYKALLRKMDSDNSGDLSGAELRHAVNYAELDIRDIAARMVVKHDSEWFGGSSHPRWGTFLKQLDPLCISYVRQWFDDMEWMSKVDGFRSGVPVWHMHPIVFLNAISQTKKKEIIFPFKVKPKNDIEGGWKRYYWAASLSDSNASQAIFGRNRSGGSRKHAARDLYSEPLTEIVAISNGVVRNISPYYMGTWQITVEHTTSDGRHFYIRYGEVDHASIVVSNGEQVQQGAVLAKTGLMINAATGQHPRIIPGQTVYMLHFEYYPGNNGTPPPNNTSILPFKRRSDLRDPIEILSEGYRSTFDEGQPQLGDRIPISELNVSDEGKAFIKGWESFSSTAYNDSEGYCTIGYGHLIARAKCEDIDLSDEFKIGITVAEADDLFESRIPTFVSELKSSVSSDLYQYEFDALISLLFNMRSMRKAPLLIYKLNQADYAGAADEFLDITNGGVSGLVKRRQKEHSLFLQGVYDSSH